MNSIKIKIIIFDFVQTLVAINSGMVYTPLLSMLKTECLCYDSIIICADRHFYIHVCLIRTISMPIDILKAFYPQRSFFLCSVHLNFEFKLL